LVDQGRRLQRVPRGFPFNVVTSNSSQLVVNHRNEFVERLLVTCIPGQQQPRDVMARWCHAQWTSPYPQMIISQPPARSTSESQALTHGLIPLKRFARN